MEADQTLHFLAGVTASGKSELALEWAESRKGEILSCDSIAIYRGMDLGSAKPTPEERIRVPHHGLDLVEVSEGYDVSRYKSYAQGRVVAFAPQFFTLDFQLNFFAINFNVEKLRQVLQ